MPGLAARHHGRACTADVQPVHDLQGKADAAEVTVRVVSM